MQEQTWGKFHCTSCCWYSVWLRGVGGVGGEVSGEVSEETIQTHQYSNCTFHLQNSQTVQASFTVPTNLGKTLANIIYCTCFCQRAGKQDRIHARTNMVKIALCKLFAGILCGFVVLVVLVVKWVKKPSKHIYILIALSTNRFNKEFKQVLPYQPREKALANIIHCTCFFQHVVNQNRSHASCCWYSVWLCGVGVGGEVSEETIPTYWYSNCAFHHQI